MLQAIELGERVDLSALLPLVYDELRQIAGRQMRRERSGHTLQTTALVHEAYIRLLDGNALTWKGKAHFYGAVAEAMRRVLVEHARSRMRHKRAGDRRRVALSLAELVSDAEPAEFLEVDEALRALADVSPRAGSVANLRLYAGLSLPETAKALDTPLRTVERDWAYARAWLYDRLK